MFTGVQAVTTGCSCNVDMIADAFDLIVDSPCSSTPIKGNPINIFSNVI
jgi:hypothetical protein